MEYLIRKPSVCTLAGIYQLTSLVITGLDIIILLMILKDCLFKICIFKSEFLMWSPGTTEINGALRKAR